MNQMQTEQPKTLVDVVQSRVHDLHNKGELLFPPNYAPENALKAAWLMLLNTTISIKGNGGFNSVPVLQHCTRDSVINTLLEMVVQGLDPVKKQCYFIPRGNQLTLEASYFGVMAVTKRVAKATDINAQVIYDGDNVTYEIEDGRIINLKHTQSFGSINKENIIGAYCIIKFENGKVHTEVMTIDEIHQSWSKSKMKKNGNGEGSTHEQFRQEMAKKTVIRRACKLYMNSSSNEDIVARYAKQADERASEATVLEEIATNANTVPLDFEPETAPAAVIEAPQPVQHIVHDDTFTHKTVQQQPHIESPNLVDQAHDESPFPEQELVQVPVQSQQPAIEQYMTDDTPF